MEFNLSWTGHHLKIMLSLALPELEKLVDHGEIIEVPHEEV